MSNTITKPTFIMVVGLPGSGKSTLIEKDYANYSVHSSDAIREELSGDVNNQTINKQVFETLHKRVKADLLSGISTVYDATNISWKRRKAFLQELNGFNCIKKCVLVATPYEVCLQRNKARDRIVPDFVIERMYRNLDVPWYNEGWDEIIVSYTDESFSNYYDDWNTFVQKHLDFEQESKWHSATLGQHCLETLLYVQSRAIELVPTMICETTIAAALHDCGKPFVKSFKDSKGNTSEFAHYYDHENVGAYKSLFYGKGIGINSLAVAALIRYHMILHFFKDWQQKTIDKYIQELTEHPYLKEIRFYDALMLLHEGDKKAH